MPSRFRGKTWIFVAGAIIFGGLASFSFLMGPLLLFGVIV
jgi:hypothetical protein